MEQIQDIYLNCYRENLLSKVRDLLNKYPEVSPEQNRQDLTNSVFEQVYDVCYVAASGSPLEELQELYAQKGLRISANTLERTRILFEEDISRLRTVFELIADHLLTCGLSRGEAWEFIGNYHVGKYVC